MALKIGDKLDIDRWELGECVVVSIEGAHVIVRAEKPSRYYESEPGNPYLFEFRKDHCEKVVLR